VKIPHIRRWVKIFTRPPVGAQAVIFLSLFFIAQAMEPFLLKEILFEVCSAFGTTGLSMGITEKLSSSGKAVIIFLMFIGRIGIVSLLLLFQQRRPADGYHFVKEHIIIGQ
jgi:Trk-type K+ transport system membrane component